MHRHNDIYDQSTNIIRYRWIHGYIGWGQNKFNLGVQNLKLDDNEIRELPPANENYFKAIGVVRGSG